jgi:hypothetical protein
VLPREAPESELVLVHSGLHSQAEPELLPGAQFLAPKAQEFLLALQLEALRERQSPQLAVPRQPQVEEQLRVLEDARLPVAMQPRSPA